MKDTTDPVSATVTPNPIAGLLGFVRSAASLLKAARPSSFDIFRPRSASRFGLADRQGDVREMIKAFRSLVFACINARAKEVANRARFEVKVKKANNELEYAPVGHPLVELMDNPNPFFTRYSLWYLTIAYMDLTGNSYWWVGRDRLGVPRSLWPLPSQLVKINAGNPKNGEDLIKSYEVDWGEGNGVTVEAEDIIHLKHPNPKDPYYYGTSLVMMAAYQVDIDQFVAEYQREFFANDAMPASVIIFKNEMNADVRAAFQSQWIEKYNRKPGQLGFLENDATIQTVVDQKEMSFLQSQGINAKRIQGVFGVPDSKLMLTESLEARATAEAMDYNFQKETIDPLLTQIGQELTKDLAVPLFDKKLVITHVSTIPRDLKLQHDLDEASLRMGKQSINEIRMRDGLDPVVGGDEPLVSFSVVPLSQFGAPPVVDDGPDDEKRVPILGRILAAGGKRAQTIELKSAKELSEAQKSALWKAHDGFRMRFEVRISRKMKEYFNSLRDDVLEKVEALKSIKSEVRSDAILFDVDEAIRRLLPIVGKESQALLQAAFEQFLKQYEIAGVVFVPNSPAMQNALGKINAKTRTVPETMHQQLRAELDEGIRLQETPDQLTQRVNQFFRNSNDYRAVRIARTVSNYAANEGGKIAAKDSGVFDSKMWISMRDAKVRDTHADVDGVKVGINSKFVLHNGDSLDVPGDPSGQPESTINCRCTAFYSKG